MEVFDFIVDSNGDLFIQDGDLAFGESTLHHQRDLLIAQKGDFKQWPLIGVGINLELLNTVGPDELRVNIQREMEQDGMRIKQLRILADYNIDLIAYYG